MTTSGLRIISIKPVRGIFQGEIRVGKRYRLLQPDEIRIIREYLGLNYQQFGRVLGLHSGFPPSNWEKGITVPLQRHVERMKDLRDQEWKRRSAAASGTVVLRRAPDVSSDTLRLPLVQDGQEKREGRPPRPNNIGDL